MPKKYTYKCVWAFIPCVLNPLHFHVVCSCIHSLEIKFRSGDDKCTYVKQLPIWLFCNRKKSAVPAHLF